MEERQFPGLRYGHELERAAVTYTGVVDETVELTVSRCRNRFDRTSDGKWIGDVEYDGCKSIFGLPAQRGAVGSFAHAGKYLKTVGVES